MGQHESSFVIYVDESGCDGFSFDYGSSHWLVLSAAITRKETDLEVVEKLIVETHREMRLKEIVPLHFRRLKPKRKKVWIKHIAESPLRLISVLIHKPSLLEPETFRTPDILYFYAIRYLLERASWCCRDHFDSKRYGGDGGAELVFSERRSLSYSRLENYLASLRMRADVRIDWNAIRIDRIAQFPHSQKYGLQIVDAVASASFAAVDCSRKPCDPSYIQQLRPVFYRFKGRFLGNGIKLFPRETDSMLAEGAALSWLRGTFS